MKQYLNRAIGDAVLEEMQRDEKVLLLGEEVINTEGAFSQYIGVPKAFPDRCLDMPIAELGYAGFAAGLAMTGYRPVVDLMFSAFSYLATDAIINTAAKYRYTTRGLGKCPIVFTMSNGSRGLYGGWSSGMHHNQCLEAVYSNIAGLKVIMPYYPGDTKGLLKAAIRDDDPVVFMYQLGALGLRGEVPEGEHVIPINKAANIIKEGKDITLVAIQGILPFAIEAAEKLKAEGIDVEVIDPRVIVPLDREKISGSVAKTGRLLIAHEASVRGNIGGEIAAVVGEDCFDKLKAPIKRYGQLCTPGPVGPAEIMMQPNTQGIIDRIKALMKY